MNYKIHFFIAFLFVTLPVCAGAADALPPLPLNDVFFQGATSPALTAQEREALALAKKWQSGDTTSIKPVQGRDGSIRFLFGAQQPSVVCAVMQVTDIELEPGEQVNGIHIGDAARWLIEPAITGTGAHTVQHVVIKPADVGLETSLMLTTDRRTYHMRLKSHKTQYMPRVSFIYPDSVMARFASLQTRQKEERVKMTTPEYGEYLGNLDFAYTVSGNGMKPVRVYNDGTKTIIHMPPSMSKTEAPTLLVLDGSDEVMVNYRLVEDRFIVDSLFDKAMLIAGVGSKQKKTTITRVGGR